MLKTNKLACLNNKNFIKRLKLFCFVILTSVYSLSCGIPSIFYLDSGSYNISFSGNGGVEDNACNVGMTFNDQNQISKCSNCPSVVLFYWIDTQRVIGQLDSRFSSLFNSYYKRSHNDGVTLRIYPSNEEVPIVPTVEEDEKKYNLYYPRLHSDSSEVRLQGPYYYYSLPSDQTSLNFDIVQEDDNKIYLVKNKGTPSESRLELVRYNMDSFSVIPSKRDIDSNTYLDYISVDSSYTEGSPLYVHFCVAFCASAGTFNNIFWSDLKIDSKLTFKIV